MPDIKCSGMYGEGNREPLSWFWTSLGGCGQTRRRADRSSLSLTTGGKWAPEDQRKPAACKRCASESGLRRSTYPEARCVNRGWGPSCTRLRDRRLGDEQLRDRGYNGLRTPKTPSCSAWPCSFWRNLNPDYQVGQGVSVNQALAELLSPLLDKQHPVSYTISLAPRQQIGPSFCNQVASW